MNVLGVMRRPFDHVGSPQGEAGVRMTAHLALLLAAVFLAAFALRLGVAVAFPNIDPSDTATREAAHRLAYGYGLLNLDWQQGVRSWPFPGFLAGVMRATEWMGAGSSGYLMGIAIVLSLVSLTAVWFSFMWAYRTGGMVAAVIAAGTAAIWYELVFYAPKAMYEVVAAHVLLPGLYLGMFGASLPERRRLFLTGLFLGLALSLRPALTPAVLFAAAAVTLKNARVRFPAIALGLLTPVVLFGVVDAFTWPYPFYSFIRFFAVNFLEPLPLGQWGLQHEWVRPWYWFLPVLAKRLGPLALLALVGVRRSPFLGWVAFVILATHSVIGHKEFRFIYPMIPIAVTLAGLGAADVISAVRAWSPWVRSPAAACVAGLAVCVAASAGLARVFPLWSRYSGNLVVFQALNRDPQVCGIALVGSEVDPVVAGNYAYLHRNVPMYFFRTTDEPDMKRLTPSFNAIITARRSEYEGFRLTRCWNGTCLYRRISPCTPSPQDAVKTLPVE